MKQSVIICLCIILSFVVTACKDSTRKSAINVTLFDKTLPEIKEYVDGKWELVSGQNARELNEFENTFIEFKGDNYTWTENGESDKGALNWRKEVTPVGYEAYLMDLFYEEYPSFPVSLKGDTLLIQDCTETAYRYKLVRR